MKILGGDIGGTKTSLALYQVKAGVVQLLDESSYVSAEYSGLNEIVEQFSKSHQEQVGYASFGIAGPVRGKQVDTTNLPWHIDADELAIAGNFQQVWLINDLEANAWGIASLSENDFFVLNEGQSNSNGNACIVSAGTGLGEAGMYWDGDRYYPFSSEGGHADFSPTSEIEIELLQFLKRRYQHVSWERVVSGQGLVNIVEFLCEYKKVEVLERLKANDPAAEISQAAQNKECPICIEAMELFTYLYGVEAGNHALKLMALGGVYIGGGIAPKNIDFFKQPFFLRGFLSKGRMEPLMRSMPVKLILNEKTAQIGPVLFAMEQLE